MPCDRSTARDEMSQLITDAWLASELTEDDQLFFDDVDGEPDASVIEGAPPSWARLTILHNERGEANLAGANSERRYTAVGIITVQLFTPRGNGLSISDKLCKIIEDALDRAVTPSGVWFRNVASREAGKSGPWSQANVTAEFEYDEIK